MNLQRLLLLSALSLSLAAASCRKKTPTVGPGDAGPIAATDAGVPQVVEAATRPSIQAFASGAELETFLKELLEAQKRDRGRVERRAKGESLGTPPPSPAPAAAAPEAAADSKEAESVTNVQHAGVDEGGIVKLHGDACSQSRSATHHWHRSRPSMPSVPTSIRAALGTTRCCCPETPSW